MNKKGQSHVEMVISFVIFLGFIFALFYFLNPFSEKRINKPQPQIVQDILIQNLTISYQHSSLILKVNPSELGSKNCFTVKDKINISSNLKVIDGSGRPVKIDKSGDNFFIEKSNDERFYRLYYASYLNANPGGYSDCDFVAEENYSYGSLSEDNALLLESLFQLNQNYLNDYDSLKNNLGFKDDFGFALYYPNRTVIFNDTLGKFKSSSFNIVSRDVPIKVINKNATTYNLVLNIRIW